MSGSATGYCFLLGTWPRLTGPLFLLSRITRENFVSSGVSKPVVLLALITYNANSVAAISDQFCVETSEGEVAKISVHRAREERGLIVRSIWLWGIQSDKHFFLFFKVR